MTTDPGLYLDLLRHGEPVGGRRYRGSIDDPLSETGWRQMHAAAERIRGHEAVWTSPLSRCREFAEEMAGRARIPCRIEAGFREIGFGEWEGHSAADLARSQPEAQARFWADPVHATPPGAEPLVDFRARVAAALENLQEEHPRGHVLVVGHGGLIRVLMLEVLQLPLEAFTRIQVPYASVTRLRLDPDPQASPMLLFHNGPAWVDGSNGP